MHGVAASFMLNANQLGSSFLSLKYSGEFIVINDRMFLVEGSSDGFSDIIYI